MDRSPVHPLTLQFRDPGTEAAFRADYERRSRPLVRAALALGLVQYAAFGWLDQWVAPIALDEVRAVRVAVCVVIAVGILATYGPRLRRWVRPAVTVGLAGGLGVVAMEWAVQHAIHTAGRGAPSGGLLILDGYYYSGMMLILIYVHVLLRLRFVTATVIGAALLASYLAVAAVHTPVLQLANAAQFLLSTQLSGMVASYALERYARFAFAHARRQAASNAELEGALRRLTAAQDRLVQAETMASLGRVTAGVAHEIQNPLNFVTNFARLTVERAADVRGQLLAEGRWASADECDEAVEALDDIALNAAKIAEHGERASAVVRSMLEHSRREPPERRAVDLNAVVAEHAALAEHGAAARLGAAVPPVALDLDPAVGEVVVAPRDLGRVLLNLLDNAYDAVGLGDGGSVRVRTRRRGEAVEVDVQDSGAGMGPGVAERAFEPFFTTKPTGQGTGLGLSLAFEIVTRVHGGEITIDTAEGAGTTVRLAVPAPRVDARPAALALA